MPTLLEGNIIYGGPVPMCEALSSHSLGQYVLDQIKLHAEQVLIIDGITGAQYTGKQLYHDIVRLAYVLRKLGIKQHDIVGLSSENSTKSAITLFACFALGATVAPLNITYTERELEHAITLIKPKIMLASKIVAERLTKIAKRQKFIKKIISFDAAEAARLKVYSFDDLMLSKRIASSADIEAPVANVKNDLALIVCSSGTTGLPKGVQVTQSNILNVLGSPYQATALDPDLKLTILSVIPWFHIFGCITVITSACSGRTLVYLPRFEPQHFLNAIEKYRVNIIFMVPPLMVFLAKHPLVAKFDLSSLFALFCGAAPLSKDIEEQIKARIGVPCIRQGYGLSETTHGVISQTDTHCKPGSVGTVKAGIYVKVIDPETGKALGANQRGELCFQGDILMKGYINDTKATQSAIRNGWLHTGDIGYYDENFEFFIVDRIKELIKYKAYQVPPAEIEALLLTHPKIKDAAVIGKPDEAAGELPMAFVVLQANETLTEKEIVAFIAERASPAKRLRGGVRFIEEIPKNPSGKILRRVLRDMLRQKPKSKL